ncbi:hypothetical protein D9M71_47080 [compost metagenome]
MLPEILSFAEMFACGWIVCSLTRFRPTEGMNFHLGKSTFAAALLSLCLMNLMGIAAGISQPTNPFVIGILLLAAWRIHRARGNIGRADFYNEERHRGPQAN